MLRKIDKGQGQWDKLLQYGLLAYRATPYIVIGYSSFQLVHGRTMRGPLETIKDGSIGGEISFQLSQAWVCEMRKRLEELFKVANSQEMRAKRKAKNLYVPNTHPRQLEHGELVLCHTPCLTSKLHISGKDHLKYLPKCQNATM